MSLQRCHGAGKIALYSLKLTEPLFYAPQKVVTDAKWVFRQHVVGYASDLQRIPGFRYEMNSRPLSHKFTRFPEHSGVPTEIVCISILHTCMLSEKSREKAESGGWHLASGKGFLHTSKTQTGASGL